MSDNENKVNENSVENFDDSNMSNFETHSTPSASQNETEISETESRIMDEGIHSTPIPVSYTHLPHLQRYKHVLG